MNELVRFLWARLDEDEQAARATTGPWKYHHETGGVVLPTARHVPELTEIVSTPRARSDARHMVRWDSARVLREVGAKRILVAMHDEARKVAETAAAPDAQHYARLMMTAYASALRIMALAYADHPDYRQGWRP